MNAPSTPNFLFILLLCNNLPRLFSLCIPFQCNSNSANRLIVIFILSILFLFWPISIVNVRNLR